MTPCQGRPFESYQQRILNTVKTPLYKRTQFRTAAAAVSALLLTVIVAACSSAGDSSELVIRPSSGNTEGDSALLTGVLRHEDGCTFVDSAASGPVVPVFADGTASWSGDTLTFSGALSAQGTAAVGDTVGLGGGVAQGIAEAWSIPEGCRVYSTFWNVAGG